MTSQAVRELLGRTFDLPVAELSDDTPLFSGGLLDSFHLLDLIAALEETTGRRILPGEVNLENLDTPRRIAALLAPGQP